MLKLDIETKNDITIVTLDGVIDAFSSQQFEETFTKLMDAENYKIIVDLSRVNYMTSVGAGIFIAVHGVAEENKGSVVLVNPKSKIREIFEVLGMSKILSFTDTIDHAIKLIEQRARAK